MARIFMGMLEFRDQLFLLGTPDEESVKMQDHFDRKFQPLLDAAQAARDAALETRALVSSHVAEIRSGKAVRFRPNQYEILHTIDSRLSQAADKLLDQSIVATKTGLQSILSDPLGLDIGFFFQQDSLFSAGVSDLHTAGELSLATYLEDVRTGWHSALQDLRTKHEHHGWSLARIQYRLTAPSQVAVYLPEVMGSPVDTFARQTANRVLHFIENMMANAMQRQCRYPIFVVEVPHEQRNPQNPQRFRLAPKGLDPSMPWRIAFRDDMDFV
jgi:hypothetical protein